MDNCLLHVPSAVLQPPAALDGYESKDGGGHYITGLLSPSANHLVAASDAPSLMLFDKTRLAEPIARYKLPDTEVIEAMADSGADVWLTAMRDGSVAVWDARAPSLSAQERLHGPSRAAYLSLATSGPFAAVGTELKSSDAYIDFWYAHGTRSVGV